ncbi:MAG: selenium cofactor biosynthesis protein YqeC [Spirochaetia bacterium]|jgi:probable selenium-dependent hydroxylase accessory protein YqeC
MPDLQTLVKKLFLPGTISTFTGAGGKSTAMRAVAGILGRAGIRVRMTTTTRVGMEEFSGYPVSFASNAAEVLQACNGPELARLIVAGSLSSEGKYAGLDPVLLEGLSLDPECVLLVEGDGSRRKPLKVPTSREPVIPPGSSLVLTLMGASGFDEPVDEEHCYNHEAAFAILPDGAGRFDAASLAALAAHPAGCRKGVMPGMGYHVILNQGDIASKRATGSEALRILGETYGIQGSLVSLQQEVLYETTEQ